MTGALPAAGQSARDAVESEVTLTPSSRGVLGAWMLAGPFPAKSAPRAPAADAKWLLASSNEGPIDLKAALGAQKDVVAFARGVLHVPRAGKHWLVLGVDDGVTVAVDGKEVHERDDSRPFHEDDDLVPLDLAEGDHPVTLRFHQRDGAWSFRARFVDASFNPVAGAFLRLPGTTSADARSLATKMSWVSVDRRFTRRAYHPRVTVRFTEGWPRGVPLGVTAKLGELFDVDAGGVPTGATGGELVVTLPDVAPFPQNLVLETDVAGRVVRAAFPSRPATEGAIAHAESALEGAKGPWLKEGSLDSVRYLTTRLADLLAHGDSDDAQPEEARELDRFATALDEQRDPFEGRIGPMRRALRSRADGEPQEMGVYVPPGYWAAAKKGRKFPLVVGLHGLNGHAMTMMRWLFGGDDPKKEQGWEDRHLGTLSPVDAIVVTPAAHGNTLYRELGEENVMQVTEWAMRAFSVDPARVTITGPSMGGIGSAGVPLHHPELFAAAEPLCGYHSYMIRGDVAGRPIRPWERVLAEERSNVMWAENGEHLPLFIVHGTQDKPEENSGVLIERYEKLHLSVKHEHPDLGHNVWQTTYEDLKGLKWLLNRARALKPSHVHFKTSRTRWGKSAWLGVDDLVEQPGWGEVDAKVRSKTRISMTTKGVTALTIDRAAAPLDASVPTSVAIDGSLLTFDNDPMTMHLEGGAWVKGPAKHDGAWKHGTVTGPLRDVFHHPIAFVYASGEEARVNEDVARSFARIRWGVDVAYPVMSDADFLARGEALAGRSLFLVGRTNKVLAALEATEPIPIHVDDGAVRIGGETLRGPQLGAAFVRPNPADHEEYVVVLAGADAAGTARALALPDLLPDFVVWDEGLAPSRGGTLLAAGYARAAGFFGKDWSIPASSADPLAPASSRSTAAP